MVRTKTKIRRIVRDYVKALAPTIQVERVILYGSYAKGNPHTWSDIDLAVVSRDFAQRTRWDRQGILGRALKGNDAMIEAIGYSIAEYNHAERLTFLGQIKRTGKVIYTRRKHRAKNSARANSRRA